MRTKTNSRKPPGFLEINKALFILATNLPSVQRKNPRSLMPHPIYTGETSIGAKLPHKGEILPHKRKFFILTSAAE
jgi:hypothetical protein